MLPDETSGRELNSHLTISGLARVKFDELCDVLIRGPPFCVQLLQCIKGKVQIQNGVTCMLRDLILTSNDAL